MENTVLDGKRYAENPHGRIDEEDGALAKSTCLHRFCGRWSLILWSLLAAGSVVAEPTTWTMNLADELSALAQTSNPESVWEATQGGVWQLLCGTRDAPFATGGYAYDSTERLVGFKAPENETDMNRKYFTFLANTNENGSVSGPWNGSVNPGEIYFHPASTDLVQLRYFIAQDGLYMVDCTLRVAGNNSGDGVSATLLLDDEPIACAATHTESLAFRAQVRAYEGQRLELSLSCLTGIANDATAIRYAISWMGDLQVPVFATSLGKVVQEAFASETHSPYCDEGGNWYFRSQPNGGDSWTDLTTKYADSENAALVGLANAATGKVYPRFEVNTSAESLNVPDATYAVEPDEVFVHPGDYTPVSIRFSPTRTGVYALRIQARNLMDKGETILRVLLNGDSLYEEFVTNCISGAVRVYADDAFSLAAGDALDIVVDPNGTYAWDGTGLKVSLSMPEDSASERRKSYSALNALRAALREETPHASEFVSPDGGVWSFGEYGTGYDPTTFTPYVRYHGGVRAFLGDSPANYGTTYYPYLYASPDGMDVSSILSHNSLSGLEIAFHPKSNKYGVLRFHVVEDGVYSISGHFRNAYDSNGGNGVDGGVVVNGVFHPRYAVVSGRSDDAYPSSAEIETEDIWLKEGDVIDFVNGPNGDFGCDATVFSYKVTRCAGLPEASLLGIDILGGSRATFAGGGRVGWAEDGTWTAVSAGRLRSVCACIEGVRRSVRLELDRAASAATIADVPTLLSDGVVSAGEDDVVAFAITGLEPGETYTLYLFSRNASGQNGVFTIGDETKCATDCWFERSVGDHCVFIATASADGEIRGTFAGTASGAATFCGLQIVGVLPEYVSRGTNVIIR